MFAADARLATLADAVLVEPGAFGKGHELDHLRAPVRLPERRLGQSLVSFGFETALYFPLLAAPALNAQLALNASFDRRTSAVPISFACDWAGVPPHERYPLTDAEVTCVFVLVLVFIFFFELIDFVDSLV